MKLAVFHDHGCHCLDPLLKKGFRHVFCAVQSGEYWVTIDGRAGLPVVEVVAAADYDMKAFYQAEGFSVVEVRDGKPIRLPFVLSNCVGIVKTILGIRSITVATPYQLYNHLRGQHVKS